MKDFKDSWGQKRWELAANKHKCCHEILKKVTYLLTGDRK